MKYKQIIICVCNINKIFICEFVRIINRFSNPIEIKLQTKFIEMDKSISDLFTNLITYGFSFL